MTAAPSLDRPEVRLLAARIAELEGVIERAIPVVSYMCNAFDLQDETLMMERLLQELKGCCGANPLVGVAGRSHNLKTWPEYFAAVRSGKKRFEIRRNDRDFAVGDILVLREFNPGSGAYTDQTEERQVTFMLSGGQFGLEAGFVAMGLSVGPP